MPLPDLISFLQAIPEGRMRRGVRFPSGFCSLWPVPRIFEWLQSPCRDLERFASAITLRLETRRLGLSSKAAPT